MEIVYTGEEMPDKFSKSLFLAGPSLRPDQEGEMESWRKDAIDILRDKGYDGVVFCPENKDGKFHEDFDYDEQVKWEDKHLNVADCIVFWVPRDLSLGKNKQPKLAALTTNIEWGTWADTGKIVLGCPKDADKVDYLKHYAEEYNVPVADSLVETLQNALDKLEDGAERSGGERFVSLFVWKQPSFQSWYQAQTKAGNRLDDARLLYTFRPKFKDFVFLWILKAKMWIEAEGRYKSNEFVLARPDISSVCLWHDDMKWTSIFDAHVVLVKEFRTPASTPDGFIRELPGGSAPSNDNPEETAAQEVHEETGMYLDPVRLKKHVSRQVAGTFSAHKAHLFSAELTSKELEWFLSQDGVAYGKEEDTERTFIEVHAVSDLLKNDLTDWATLGMIMQVLGE